MSKGPRLSGLSLFLVSELVGFPGIGSIIKSQLLKNARVDELRDYECDAEPLLMPPIPRYRSLESIPEQSPPTQFPTHKNRLWPSIQDFHNAYKSGKTTPTEVAQKLSELATVHSEIWHANIFLAFDKAQVAAAAEASTKRWKEGKPLGILDGVPIAIKDEIDVKDYKTTVGTRFMGTNPAKEDGFIVKKLRDAGAIIAGKTNMHEVGIGVSGFNAHYGAVGNPYNLAHSTGGSSSGSAAAVAAGIVPVAIGADGGGSIRMPAGLCGVFGIKSTHGRISEAGAAPLCWSVAHLGPISAYVEDAYHVYNCIAGANPADELSCQQGPLHQPKFDPANLKGRKIGIIDSWFNTGSDAVKASVNATLEKLTDKFGLEIVRLKYANIDIAETAHLVTIVSEMATTLEKYWDEHMRTYGRGVRLTMHLANSLTNRDYIKAQQIRKMVSDEVYRFFDKVDYLVTPTTGCTAPRYQGGRKAKDCVDLDETLNVIRFATLANLTGIPGCSVNSGYADGLPIGMQFMAAPWQEHTLFEIAAATQGITEIKQPDLYIADIKNLVC